MEILAMYSVYDEKGDRYDTPFFAHNDLFAQRRFHILIHQEGTMLNHFKNDFKLYKILNFNVVTGVVESDRKLVMDGKQVDLT